MTGLGAEVTTPVGGVFLQKIAHPAKDNTEQRVVFNEDFCDPAAWLCGLSNTTQTPYRSRIGRGTARLLKTPFSRHVSNYGATGAALQ